MHEEWDAFGDEAANLLYSVQDHLTFFSDDVEGVFGQNISQPDLLAKVVQCVGTTQYNAIKMMQKEHFRHLLDPDLSKEVCDVRARRMGQIYAFVGIEMTRVVAAYRHYSHIICPYMDRVSLGSEDRARFFRVLTTRLMVDLEGQIRGQRDIAQAQQKAIDTIVHLPDTSTTSNDLVRRLLETVAGLEGMMACTLARPDDNGDLQFEVVVGQTLEMHVAILAEQKLVPSIYALNSRGQGPSG